MFTRFEEFAATQMLGQPDSPPRSQGKLHFDHDWQRKLFGMALAVAKEGHFEWEDFRKQLIRSIGDWEQLECDSQPPWDYYERFLEALTRALEVKQLATGNELAQALAPR
ncbi:MAG: nitrile hydratase accessory protein [Burkholderiales bacterium RIFCSPLOWO2_12_FULL_64_99]|nr:MAG: nitrile hydratase accessory protein [Burkholderiales bacterium RIFCSPHIGHO2_12_FULL_63_20]OGB65244.1 MAG: nitrile hydratase accessory protein [Burkholderiales bacterium RIFCSPLOWO2_12_FULL_64_99]